MEFNFNSYDTSKQTISYCEVDKCKVVIKYKQALEKVREIAKELTQTKIPFWAIYEQITEICDEVNE